MARNHHYDPEHNPGEPLYKCWWCDKRKATFKFGICPECEENFEERKADGLICPECNGDTEDGEVCPECRADKAEWNEDR